MTDNPYRPGVKRVKRVLSDDDIVPRSKDTLLFPIVMLIGTALAAWLAPVIIRVFEEILTRFGSEIPGITRFVFETRYWWVIFLVGTVALTIWIARPKEQLRRDVRRKTRMLMWFSLVFGLAASVAYFALYIPLILNEKIFQ